MTRSEVEQIFTMGDSIPGLSLEMCSGVWFAFSHDGEKRLRPFGIMPTAIDHFGPYVFGQTRRDMGLPIGDDEDDSDSIVKVRYNESEWSLRMFNGVLWHLACHTPEGQMS